MDNPAKQGSLAAKRDGLVFDALCLLRKAEALTEGPQGENEAKIERALEKAMAWLGDVTDPLEGDDLAKWDEIGPGYCEDTAPYLDAQGFYNSLNDSDRRTVVIMNEGD